MTDFEQLAVFRLGKGAHSSAEDGVCAMEAVAWLEGLEHCDSPACTCPVIGNFVRCVNDHARDEQRQRLVAYLPRLVTTVSPAHELQRRAHLAEQSLTRFAAFTLEMAKFSEHAVQLRALPKLDWDKPAEHIRAASDIARDVAMAEDTRINRAARIVVIEARTAIVELARRYNPRIWMPDAYVDACVDSRVLESLRMARQSVDMGNSNVHISIAEAAEVAWMNACLQTLDEILAIGPQSPGFSKPVETQVAAYRELISV